MIYARLAGARRPALRRARRGALPPGRLPRPGVGGGDHPPAAPTSRLVCLSATVSNAEELADWITTVRGPDRRRSSRSAGRSSSSNLYLVGDRTSDRLHLLPTLVDGRPEPGGRAARRRGRCAAQWPRTRSRTPAAVHAAARRGRRAARRARDAPGDLLHLQPQPRATTRSRQCLDAGAAADDGRASATASARSSRPRLAALDRRRPRRARLRPVARRARGRASPPTTPGMVPPFKEAVEACFADGLVKVVFATETLAARHQHAGPLGRDREADQVHRRAPRVPDAGRVHPAHRAGRAAGHRRRSATPSCCGRPFVPVRPGRRAGRRAARSASRSAFRPTYNMAANLVRRYTSRAGPPPAQPVVRPVPGRPRRRAARGPPRAAQGRFWPNCWRRRESPYGDIERVPAQPSPDVSVGPTRRRAKTSSRALARLQPGDVIMLRGGKHAGRAAVLTVAQRRGGGVRIRAHHTEPHPRARCPSPTSTNRRSAVGEIDLPTPFAPNRQAFQREVARELDRVRPRPERAEIVVAESGLRERTRRSDPATIHELDDRLKAAAQADRVAREVRRAGATGSAAASARSPAGSTACSASSRRGATSTAGRSPRPARGSPRSSTRATCSSPRRSRQGLLDDLDPAALAGAGVGLHLRAPQPRCRRPRRGSRRRRSASDAGRSPRWPPSSTAIEDEAGLDRHPSARPDVRSPSPTPGRPAKPSPTCSRTRSCPAATSCAT